MSAGAAASIHARLLALAKARGEDFNLTLNRYALERFLYRLLVSPSREQARTTTEAVVASLRERYRGRPAKR